MDYIIKFAENSTHHGQNIDLPIKFGATTISKPYIVVRIYQDGSKFETAWLTPKIE